MLNAAANKKACKANPYIIYHNFNPVLNQLDQSMEKGTYICSHT